MNRIIRLLCPKCIFAALLLLAGSNGVQGQITELVNATTARVHLYFRFADQAEISDVTLYYGIGATVSQSNLYRATLSTETVLGRLYYKTTLDVPYDAVNRCLAEPVYIPRRYLSWKEGLLSARQFCDNDMFFYGDAYLFVEQKYWWAIRYDYVTVDEYMEEAMMYVYDPATGLSSRLTPDDYGHCTYSVNTQDFRHVGNRTYDMSQYPAHTELVLARKSAYQSWL